MTTRKQNKYGNTLIKNMGGYHDFFLKTDVLLLTDVFEKFRDMCLSYYGLDPVYYYTLPNFAFDAMLKLTGIEIDLVYDQEMYEMITWRNDTNNLQESRSKQ